MSAMPFKSRKECLAAERVLRPAGGGGGPLRVALVYPNSYHVGMSSLGFQLAWRVINDSPSASAERFFMDTLDWGSIESGAALGDFDVIAFSAAYEMDDPNIVDAIEAAGLPPLARDRAGRRFVPLVLVGGVLVSVNRLPLYPFADGFLHGDAEVALPAVLGALAEAKGRGAELRRARIEAIEGLPGVEITPGARISAGLPPGADGEALSLTAEARGETPLPVPIAPAAPRLDQLENDLCATQILTPHTEFSDMALVDLARGCPHHCTFCWIGHNTPPYRQRTMGTLAAAIEAWMPHTSRFGLVSSAVGAHTEIDDICRWMMARELKVSYSSLRVEEVTPTMLEALAKGGQKTITIAPEAGNMRVRRLLGKKISDDQILEVVERAMSLGAENIKLYYMIGIPSETDEEAMDIYRFSERVRAAIGKWGRARGRMGYLGVNLGVFVPKPNLPLNHIEPAPLADVKRRLKAVVARLGRMPNARVAVSSPDLALAQSVLSMGGVEAARYIVNYRANGRNWRRANQLWRREAEAHHEAMQEMSRLPGSRLVARSAGVA